MTRGVLGSRKNLSSTRKSHYPTSPKRPPTPQGHGYQLSSRYDYLSSSCSRNTRLPPYPQLLLHFQRVPPAPGCWSDSFHGSSSPPTRPIPPTVTQPQHHTTDYQPSSHTPAPPFITPPSTFKRSRSLSPGQVLSRERARHAIEGSRCLAAIPARGF